MYIMIEAIESIERYLVGNKTLFFRRVVTIITLLIISTVIVSTGVKFVHAAQLTTVSDTLSNPTTNASSTHSIVFTVPTAIANSGVITITFGGYANLGGVATTSVDILVGNSTTTAVQQTIQPAAAASVWGVSTSTNVMTITAPTSGGTITSGQVMIVNIGTNAISIASGTQMLTNPTVGSYGISIVTPSDSGSTTVNIISNAVVSMTASIAQSLSFAILSSTSTAFSNNTFFGTLSSSNVKFASSSVAVAGDTASTSAHVLTVSTNAPAGYVITLQGDTLRNQNATGTFITPIGAVATGGVVGANQFGIFTSASGGTGANISSTYGTTNKYGYNASSTVADTLAFGNVPTTTTTYSIQYMVNISATQAAGSYSTAVTYVGTANF